MAYCGGDGYRRAWFEPDNISTLRLFVARRRPPRATAMLDERHIPLLWHDWRRDIDAIVAPMLALDAAIGRRAATIGNATRAMQFITMAASCQYRARVELVHRPAVVMTNDRRARQASPLMAAQLYRHAALMTLG